VPIVDPVRDKPPALAVAPGTKAMSMTCMSASLAGPVAAFQAEEAPTALVNAARQLRSWRSRRPITDPSFSRLVLARRPVLAAP
jgi:hypothetical protein